MPSKSNSAFPLRVKAAPPQAIAPIDPERLYSRAGARPYLGGIHNATMIRLERAGRLIPIKLNPHAATAKVHYRGSDLIKLRKSHPIR